MQDLDIRGSGNLLGGEQSGFIADVGFETYQRILNEALIELRDSEYREPSDDQVQSAVPVITDTGKIYVSDFQIDTDLEIMFPDEYISNISERIRLYKELNEISSDDALLMFEKNLIDRFGEIPSPAQALLDIVRLKWIAVKLGIEKILLKNDLLIAYFVSDHNSPFYRSALFVSIMNYVNRKPRMNMKQKGTKLSLTMSEVRTVKGAIKVLIDIIAGQ
jgi:transcription-repair coupling factor (superfamily II helicase)